MRVKCLAQEHNTMSLARDQTAGPLAPESSAPTIRPPRLPLKYGRTYIREDLFVGSHAGICLIRAV